MHRVTAFFLVATVMTVGLSTAQPRYGDLILSDLNGQQQLWVLNRTTGMFTTLSPPTIEYPTCVIMAKNNTDIAMSLASRWCQTTYLGLVSRTGVLTTLSLGAKWHNSGSVALHENGTDYVVAMWWANSLWRVNLTTGNTLTSCVIQSITSLGPLTRDSDSGDWVVGGTGLYRVSEVNCAETTLSMVAYLTGSVDLEPRTGHFVCSDDHSPSILVVDRNTGRCLNSFNVLRTQFVKVDDFTGNYSLNKHSER